MEKKLNPTAKMSKNFSYTLMGIVFAFCTISAHAAGASVASVPEGMITFSLPHASNTFLSLPLTNNATYTSTITAVTGATIGVSDSPAPFTTSLSTAAAPYFVKFLTGNETGRVLLISSNTANTLTLDTSDHASGMPIALTTTGFDVEVGDTFEIFPGDTLASIFGTATAQSPLLLTGAPNVGSADTVSLYTTNGAAIVTYYFNTNAGYWEQYGTAGNANNTVIYPYAALSIIRRSDHPDTTLVVSGRVSSVQANIKVQGDETVFASTHFAADIKLSQLNLGSNWATGSFSVADTIGVWNAASNSFVTYYQLPDSTWRMYPDANTDQSNVAIAAGTVTNITKRESVTGAATFLQSPLPYSLD